MPRIFSGRRNKKLSPNAANENERIKRRRLMKLSAFGEDCEGKKLMPISANFRTNENELRSLLFIRPGTKAKKPSHSMYSPYKYVCFIFDYHKKHLLTHQERENALYQRWDCWLNPLLEACQIIQGG
jgi:hypothetical protein